MATIAAGRTGDPWRGRELLRDNDTAIFVHLKMAEQLCPEDVLHKTVRNMVSTLVKRAKLSYSSEVRKFAGQIGLLD